MELIKGLGGSNVDTKSIEKLTSVFFKIAMAFINFMRAVGKFDDSMIDKFNGIINRTTDLADEIKEEA